MSRRSQIQSQSAPQFLQQLREMVAASAHPGMRDRRGNKRFEYISAARCVWLRKDGQLANGENSLTLITKDLSAGGVGFFHTEPMVIGDRLRMNLVRPDKDAMDLVVEVRHCRKIGHQTYLIGAKLLG